MKTRFFLVTLLLLSMLTGCLSISPPTTEPTHVYPTVTADIAAPSPTPALAPTLAVMRTVRPGVFVTNEASVLPLPTSGYDVYVIGEPHGEREVHLLALDYLKTLNETIGLHDIMLEMIAPAYETEVNAYVLGLSDTALDEWCVLAEVLGGVRALNETLPDDEKIRVHLVDLDSGAADSRAALIHTHLQVVHSRLGTAAEHITIPELSQFEDWSEDSMLTLVDQLEETAGGRETIGDELATIGVSVRYHCMWRQYFRNTITLDEAVERSSNIREERVTQNIQQLLEELQDTPVLALYGGWHAQKRPAMSSKRFLMNTPSWTQRLCEAGVPVYSVLAMGLSGWANVNVDVPPTRINRDATQMRFSDNTSLANILAAATDYDIVYVDLRLETNASLRLGADFEDVPAGEVYDGLVLFREVTPLELVLP